MSRLNRPAPLPSTQRPQVPDATVQRAFDSLATPLAAVVKFLLPFVQPEKWQPVAFLNGFGNFATTHQAAAYRKNPFGRVELRGLVKRSTAALVTPIFVLPAGYRPARSANFLIMARETSARLEVEASGVLQVTSAVAVSWFDYFNLDGITFDTEA